VDLFIVFSLSLKDKKAGRFPGLWRSTSDAPLPYKSGGGTSSRAKGGELLEKFPINAAQRKVMRAMTDCRSVALGGHRDSCDSCGFEHVFWNSCRNRHCPGCGGEARQQWLDARRDEVLDVPYFHIVFTIPEILNVLALYAPEVVYAILLRTAEQALLDLGASRLHARMGVLTVLHTWGRPRCSIPMSTATTRREVADLWVAEWLVQGLARFQAIIRSPAQRWQAHSRGKSRAPCSQEVRERPQRTQRLHRSRK
jgi:hypothetical protein